MAAVERLAGTLPGGLRRTVVAQQATVEQPAQGPGLVVLDRHGQRQRTGARLDGEPQGRVSVIIEPPRPDELAPLLVAAYGLSDREQAVAALVFQGRSTRRQIARALSISPYTVQERLTAVFDKVGVRSRGELVGQAFFRHCLPAIPD
jgi:DNA-binding NarL/FixJ family response regulator